MDNPSKLLKFSFKSKLPIITQAEITECGLACVVMIANYHGYKTDIVTLRKEFPVSLKGTTLKDIYNICGKLELQGRPVQLELKDLKNLKTPCILHWDLDHFVVLKEVRSKTVIIHDPAVGVVKLSFQELSKHFTGVAMELSPTIKFKKTENQSQLKLLDILSSIKGIKNQLLQILLVSFSLEIFSLISPLFIQLVTDSVVVSKDLSLLIVLVTGFSLLVIIQSLTEYIRSWIVVFISNVLNIQLASSLIRHLLRLPLDFFEKRHIGDIISRFESMQQIQEKISTEFILAIIDGFMIIITLTMMMIYSTILSLIVLLALSIYIISRLALYPTMKYQTNESIIKTAREQSTFIESVRAILPIKIFNKESLRENIWQNMYADKLNANIRLSKLRMLYKLFLQVVFGIEHIIIIFLAATYIMNNEGFSIGMLMAYLAYRSQFVGKAQEFVERFIQYKMLRLHLDRIADIALTDQEINSSKTLSSKPIVGSVKVQDLSYRYNDNEDYIFKHISFEINPGEVLVILGASGCGKTTLLKVLLSLLKQSEGKIYIDGRDMEKIDIGDYRSQISAVTQEDILLTGSIAENICFFEQEPDYNRMHECAFIAAIHHEIEQMPMSYSTLIGDMGSSLSGGQKQRILLARALYSGPKILFLDEATSNLDTKNEEVINQNIKKLGITRIIVSHRKDVTQIADQVLTL